MTFNKKCFQKRSVLATAVLGLSVLACNAQAQSSVQVYGLIDMSVGSTKAPGGASIPGVDSGKMTTSFFGFSGTEDLGGGLSLKFLLESFMRADTGEAARFAGDSYFARSSSVALSHKDLGTLSIGRNATPLFGSTLAFNAFAASFGYSPSIRHYFAGGQGGATGDTAWNDAISYASPSLGGFRVNLSAAFKEGSNGGNSSAGVGYGNGPLALSLVHQSVEKDGAAAVQDTDTTQFGASYDFGVLKAFLQYGEVKNKSTDNKTDILGLGARVPLGQGAFIAQYGSMDPRVGAERDTLSLGYLHTLSRRTELYGVVMHDKVDGLSSGGGYSLGIRHSF